jgi:hypothetical protein
MTMMSAYITEFPSVAAKQTMHLANKAKNKLTWINPRTTLSRLISTLGSKGWIVRCFGRYEACHG